MRVTEPVGQFVVLGLVTWLLLAAVFLNASDPARLAVCGRVRAGTSGFAVLRSAVPRAFRWLFAASALYT